ncbi:hypothetical protein AGMMS49991_11730 [Spirochaetia bacterium]|nr:hypothetical protein AGMMS49991_11730 [Spirochaetia bacterium]
MNQTKLSGKENFLQTVKYFCFAASAGAIQAITFTILTEAGVFRDADQPYGPSYFIALVLSIVWNFTLNRRYTFKSSNNVPVAMLKVFGYYCVFTPLSIWWGNALTRRFPQHWAEYVVLAGTMIINGVTEFLFLRFLVFDKSINTNKAALRDAAKKRGEAG